MATLTDRKIVATKRALAIVTTHTTLRTAGRVMVSRLGSSDLLSLWQSRPDLMTLIAV